MAGADAAGPLTQPVPDLHRLPAGLLHGLARLAGGLPGPDHRLRLARGAARSALSLGALAARQRARGPRGHPRIGLIYVLFTIGFVLFALLMGGLEQQIGMPANLIGWALLIVTIGLYAVIGVANRAHTLDDYFVAGDASSLLQRHGDRGRLDERGLVHLDGRHTVAAGLRGLAYIMGWTGGYVLLALLVAPTCASSASTRARFRGRAL